MGRISDILRRLPLRTTLRMLANGAVALYLVSLGIEGFASYLEQPGGESGRGLGLALYGGPARRTIAPAQPRLEPAAAFGLQELKQTHKILGIICRDEQDRSVFVRDLASGLERIYRVGDHINEAVVTEIHPSSIILNSAGSRIVLSLFAQDPEPLDE
ncbi:MAG: hypothetical protein HY816_18100 [Candidatus Wallbacteria bacterium]|nr:hypothetical protein [Candidatus Wallbacteria bacterium]